MKLQGLDKLFRNMQTFSDKALVRVGEGLGRAIAEAENTAKLTAPWTDRTGNARASITGSGPVTKGGTIMTALAIGMYYGVYLELCYQGRYRVVWPTLEWIRTRVPNHLKGVIK